MAGRSRSSALPEDRPPVRPSLIQCLQVAVLVLWTIAKLQLATQQAAQLLTYDPQLKRPSPRRRAGWSTRSSGSSAGAFVFGENAPSTFAAALPASLLGVAAGVERAVVSDSLTRCPEIHDGGVSRGCRAQPVEEPHDDGQKSLSENSALLERVAGIEPASSAWKAAALPLCYTRARRRLARERPARKAKRGLRAPSRSQAGRYQNSGLLAQLGPRRGLRHAAPSATRRLASGRSRAGVAEWLKAADCKSARVCVRWFESNPLHHPPFPPPGPS